MKKVLVAAILAVFAFVSCAEQDKAVSKQDGMYLVDTSQIENDIVGYNGPVPVLVYIKDNTVVKVEMLENTDGKRHNDRVFDAIGASWDGKPLAEAAALEVDAVSGSTFTSNALIGNVRLGITYFQSKKRK